MQIKEVYHKILILNLLIMEQKFLTQIMRLRLVDLHLELLENILFMELYMELQQMVQEIFYLFI